MPLNGKQNMFCQGECAVRMAHAGADVVGANCLFDPFINLSVIKRMKKKLDEENISIPLMCQVGRFNNRERVDWF